MQLVAQNKFSYKKFLKMLYMIFFCFFFKLKKNHLMMYFTGHPSLELDHVLVRDVVQVFEHLKIEKSNFMRKYFKKIDKIVWQIIP